MSIYMTIKNPDIKGSSTIKQFSGAFILQSFSWGLGLAIGSLGGGAGVGKPHATQLTVTYQNASAPLILDSLIKGTNHTVTLYVETVGAGGVLGNSETLEFRDARFTSFQESATDPSSIQLTLTYADLVYTMGKDSFEYAGSVG